MRTRSLSHQIVLVALFFAAPCCLADPLLQVASWSMQFPTGTGVPAMNQPRIQEAAEALKKLDPDVILLHQVRDWQMCAQLADALRPAVYNVLICSAFRSARTGPTRTRQVAILSKYPAYFSWAETWRSQSETDIPGGFVFAAVDLQSVRVGLFCVQIDEQVSRALASQRPVTASTEAGVDQQWLAAIESFNHWVTNRIEAAVISGTIDMTGMDASRLLGAAGFARSFLGAPLKEVFTPQDRGAQRSTSPDYIAARVTANADSLAGAVLTYAPARCDLALVPSPGSAGNLVRASDLLPSAVRQAGEHPATAISAPTGSHHAMAGATKFITAALWPLAAVLGVPALLALAWLLVKRKRRRARAAAIQAARRRAAASQDYTVLVASHSVTASASDDSIAPALPGSVIHLDAPAMAQTQSAAWQRSPAPAEQPAHAGSAELPDGLVPHLREWLKQKLVSRLIADRAKLMADQHAATLKALAVDERLARIEAQIQQQNQIYEQRIEELTRELLAAREENRELIRVRINQVKAEMEAVRARIMAEAQAESWGER